MTPRTLDELCSELKSIIEKAYTEGVTVMESERLAALTLSTRLELADMIKVKDLDARMKKNGVKVVRANAYMNEITEHEKKPSEGYLDHAINQDPLVRAEEKQYAEAEVECDRLTTYNDVFKDAHIYFRSIAKGNYE